jgi:hypothetical protein
MMNRIAKLLVVIQTGFSLLFLTWAGMVYFQFNDFGWKEPHKIWETKDSGFRVASVLDRRTAILYEMYRQKDRALPGVKPALETLTRTMTFFPKNHQFYMTELDKLRHGDGKIAPQQLTWKDGQLVLDNELKPTMKNAVPGIEKSTKQTGIEREGYHAQIEAILPEIDKLVKDTDAITIQLYGTRDDKGNTLDIGLYEILENEATQQSKIREERLYITPLYADALRRVETFRDRLAGARRTLTTNLPK